MCFGIFRIHRKWGVWYVGIVKVKSHKSVSENITAGCVVCRASSSALFTYAAGGFSME